MLQDLRHGARLLLQNKGWTLVVILSVALGIGTNTALFGAVNGLWFKTLGDVSRPDELVRLKYAGKNDMGNDFSDYGFSSNDSAGQSVRATFSNPMFETLRANSHATLVDLAAGAPRGQVNFVVDGRAEIVRGYVASGNFFQLLSVKALAGRIFLPEDDSPSATPVGVLSEGFWRRRFGGNADVLGKVVQVNNTPVTIVGVTPAAFTGIQQAISTPPDITVPLALDARLDDSGRLKLATSWWLPILGRLRPGVTAEQVQGSLDGLFQQTARAGWTAYFAGLNETSRSQSNNQNRVAVPHLLVDSGARGIYDATANDARSMSLLTVVVIVLLLIVCANVANLLLSRATARRKEISVRLSLGASRWRLIRQLLTESVLLATAGGAAGLIVGNWGRHLLPLPAAAASLDWRLFTFVTLLTLLTGILFGIVPALRATRLDVNSALKETSRAATGTRSTLSKALLVVQVAMSLVLLVGAGLFLNTLRNLRSVDVGFDTSNLMLFRLAPALSGYDKARAQALFRDVQERVAALPGVRAVGVSQPPLLSGGISSGDIFIEGHDYANSESGPGESTRKRGSQMYQMTVSSGFFQTLGIPLLAGRLLTDRDDDKAPRVVVINETAARKYFSRDSPVGKRFGNLIENRTQTEIVGVVRDVKYNSLREPAPPTIYLPIGQRNWQGLAVEVRTASDPASLVAAVRDVIRRIDPNLPLTNMTTQAEAVEGRLAQERLFAQAYVLFGLLALALASIGLFGVMSYSVARRTNEIGIRMALGARQADVLSLVMKESMAMVLIGVVIGLAGAFAASRLVATLLFGLAPTDPTTMGLAVAVMTAVSAFAGYLPARRAARVDPMIALRYE
jgi:predicted permease